MCLVIAVVLAIFAFNVFVAGDLLSGSMALAGSLFFIYLMIRNIRHVKSLRAGTEASLDEKTKQSATNEKVSSDDN